MSKRNSITELINSVEKEYLEVLWNECKAVFYNKYIPSHDHMHHLRVWSYMKNLVQELSLHTDFTKTHIEQLIISCFFHDMGLSITLNEKHGLESRILCENFIDKNYSCSKEVKEEILEAVEKHDEKNYKTISISELPSDVYSILTVCDDLDAFGYTGIYRYAEIYLMRGLPIDELGKAVQKNVRKRFLHFIDLYGKLEDFSKFQEARFAKIDNFYGELQKAINSNEKNFQSEFIDCIYHELLEKKKTIQEFVKDPAFEYQKEYIKDTFRQLEQKLYPQFNF